MPICIECRYPVSTLYTTYSKADDKALGKGVRLTQCPRCKRFADKYVEHDFVVLFIDLVLIKPQVYRHLLFNRLGRDDDKFDPSIKRLGVLLLLFDVYLTWARIEKATPSIPSTSLSLSTSATSSANTSLSATNGTTTLLGEALPSSFLASQPILLQYIFFLALCALETASFHIPIRALLCFQFSRPFASIVPHYPRPALISTALLVSSFTKLFPLLLLVWNYDLPSSASAVSWAVIINNIAALEILLDCGYIKSTLLCGVGAIFRASVGWGILRAVGVDGGVAAAGVVETGDIIDIWRQLTDALGLA
ncbi:ARV1-like protein [Dissoconium aciculare CBS 342.82]|uniref:Protein ARV n=1 Tax=Dissoconium aciculare CBS 342.82 TaxID=1314786 RepID=A0A6J3LYH3_9PEZI|nr:ARV1-like protein [Dissoconium aciculare CBS 342.82]KAF1819677.1 ARV1-like protein [Dissoconium aciculare CBS 342.82]